MIESIEREGTKVVIRINTGLNVNENILHFEWEAEDETFAELLKYRLWDQESKYKANIARQPWLCLEPKEISELKSKLVHGWNGSKHCWK